MEHLALEIFDLTGIGSKYANLPEDASITITDTSEIFASGDVWSHSFTLNIPANLHIFGTAGDIHGSRLHEQINKRRARLWVEGLPLFLGYLKLDDEVEVDEDGNVDVTFESGQKTFEDMMNGMNARDVPMLADHLIGVAVWRERTPYVRINYKVSVNATSVPGEGYVVSKDTYTVDVDLSTMQKRLSTRWPKYVVHSGTFKTPTGSDYVVSTSDTLNTDYPYDDNAPASHPYCNANYGYQKKDKDGNAVRGYTIHEKGWPNTAPCFYVMYWFRALMKHLGIYIEENQMQNVEDLRRLFMMNTLCAYDEPEEAPSATSGDSKDLKLTGISFPTVRYTYDLKESKGIVTSSNQHTLIGNKNIAGFDIQSIEAVGAETVYGHPAYATSDCFPNVDAMEIINALQDAFGVRLLFSGDYTRVRAVLLRDIFRSQDVAKLDCEIIEDTKTENSVRGFLMSYGSDDTAFKLPMFDKVLDKEHDTDTSGNNYTLTEAEYSDIIKDASAFNKHLYYINNGNTYAYKVDEDAKRYKELFPSLFEIAGFMDAVDGKCSGEQDTFKSISLAFSPLIVNDANMEQERAGSTEQKFFAYVGEEMKCSGEDFSASGDIYFETKVRNAHVVNEHIDRADVHWYVDMDVEGYIFETYMLERMKDNYEQNDDGVAPIETHDWGLTLGVMRGSGNDAHVAYEPDTIEREDPMNDWWEIIPGTNATVHPDTCDSYGNEWYYSAGVDEQTVVVLTDEDAVRELQNQFPNSNAPFWTEEDGYINKVGVGSVYTLGKTYRALFALSYSKTGATYPNNVLADYQRELYTPYRTAEGVMEYDRGVNGKHLIIELDSSRERGDTLIALCEKAYGSTQQASVLLDHGIGSRYGRFSLKLRAEKPNPNFDPTLPETRYDPEHPELNTNPRYLTITNPNLRGRGLCDQFYKEFSHFIRNARIWKGTVRMELAQLLAIDKTVRVTVGDVTGFIRKMQYSVSNQTGLGEVTMEIMYI